MNSYDLLNFINAFYRPWEIIFNFMFFYSNSFLRTLSVSIILILTLGKVLSIFDTKFSNLLKWIIYIFFMGYSLYALGIFTNLLDLNALDWVTFLLSIFAPLSMFVVGKQAMNVKIKGHKIFVYYVIMVIYLLIGILWEHYLPDSLIFTVFAVYFAVALFTVILIDKRYG